MAALLVIDCWNWSAGSNFMVKLEFFLLTEAIEKVQRCIANEILICPDLIGRKWYELKNKNLSSKKNK